MFLLLVVYLTYILGQYGAKIILIETESNQLYLYNSGKHKVLTFLERPLKSETGVPDRSPSVKRGREDVFQPNLRSNVERQIVTEKYATPQRRTPKAKPSTKRKECATLSGEKCVFPFKWVQTNKTYTGCTSDGEGFEYWCSTKVDEAGYHVSGNWAECKPGCRGVPLDRSGLAKPVQRSCKTVDPKWDCVMPLNIDGYSYKGCIVNERTGPTGECLKPDQEVPGTYKKVECSPSCPKDYLITDRSHPIEDLLKTLMNKLAAHTTSIEGSSCLELLEVQFAGRNTDKLPTEVREAQTLTEAVQLACENSVRCRGRRSSVCRDYQIERRMNVVDRSSTTKQLRDCQISCGSV